MYNSERDITNSKLSRLVKYEDFESARGQSLPTEWVTPCHNLAWEETRFLALQSNPDNGITLQAQKNRSKATFMQDTSGRNMD